MMLNGEDDGRTSVGSAQAGICSRCRSVVPRGSSFCPGCGASIAPTVESYRSPTGEDGKRSRRVALGVSAVLVVLSVIAAVVLVRTFRSSPSIPSIPSGDAAGGDRVLKGPPCVPETTADTAAAGFDDQVSRELGGRVFQDLPPEYKETDLASDVGPLTFQYARTADRDTSDQQESILDPQTLVGAHQKFFLTPSNAFVVILLLEFQSAEHATAYLARRKDMLPKNAAPYEVPSIPGSVGYETGTEGRSEVVVRFQKGRRVARVDVVDSPKVAKTAARFVSEGQCALL
jgi:hypothetical protein